MNDISQGIDRPYGRDPETREAAARHLILTGRAWAIDILGLTDVSLPERYAAARDKLLAAEPVPAVERRGVRSHNANPIRAPRGKHPNCTCAPTGAPYSLCPTHGEPGIAEVPQRTPRDAP